MHQHVIAANHYNYINGRPGKALLEKVAANELVLISTGAGDWLASSGSLTKTEDGYLFNGTKHFASGSPAGDVIVTSGPYEDPDAGWQVLAGSGRCRATHDSPGHSQGPVRGVLHGSGDVTGDDSIHPRANFCAVTWSGHFAGRVMACNIWRVHRLGHR